MATQLEDTRGCLNFLLRRTSRIVARYYDEVLKPTGLRTTQFNVLAVLAQTGPISFSKLASILGMERSALARNLKPLERSGYLIAIPGEDKRMRMAELTQRGKEKLKSALPHWAKAQNYLAQELGSGNVSRLTAMLKNVIGPIDSKR